MIENSFFYDNTYKNGLLILMVTALIYKIRGGTLLEVIGNFTIFFDKVVNSINIYNFFRSNKKYEITDVYIDLNYPIKIINYRYNNNNYRLYYELNDDKLIENDDHVEELIRNYINFVETVNKHNGIKLAKKINKGFLIDNDGDEMDVTNILKMSQGPCHDFHLNTLDENIKTKWKYIMHEHVNDNWIHLKIIDTFGQTTTIELKNNEDLVEWNHNFALF